MPGRSGPSACARHHAARVLQFACHRSESGLRAAIGRFASMDLALGRWPRGTRLPKIRRIRHRSEALPDFRHRWRSPQDVLKIAQSRRFSPKCAKRRRPRPCREPCATWRKHVTRRGVNTPWAFAAAESPAEISALPAENSAKHRAGCVSWRKLRQSAQSGLSLSAQRKRTWKWSAWPVAWRMTPRGTPGPAGYWNSPARPSSLQPLSSRSA